MERGYIQVYTGNGKGKTTAAIGLALRAICAGKKVYFGQFAKGMNYSELKIPELLNDFTMEQFGRDAFINGVPTEKDMEFAEKGLEKIETAVVSGEYDVVVLDELNIVLYYKLLDISKVLDILKRKNPKVEIIITGRYADPEIVEAADLVTEMKEIKHYYKKGVTARKGIEN